MLSNLQQRGASPRTVKTLTSTISALFQKQLSDSDVAAILKALREQGMDCCHRQQNRVFTAGGLTPPALTQLDWRAHALAH